MKRIVKFEIKTTIDEATDEELEERVNEIIDNLLEKAHTLTQSTIKDVTAHWKEIKG